jgi:hypothetical protein
MAAKRSAAGFAAKGPDHLHTESRRWPPKGQQQVLQQRDQITYTLKVGDDHQKGQQQVLQQGDQITYFLQAGDGYQKVSREFVMNEWSEYNMYINNSHLQTTMTNSNICLYVNM